jgi:hypothetical protein
MENEHVLGGLTRKRGEIAGQIEHTQALLRKLVTELDTIDAAILVFDPEANPHAIPPKRRYRRAASFQTGKLIVLILDALRVGARPMGLPEIVAAIVSTLGHDEAVTDDLTPRVKAGLFYLTKFRGLTVKTGDKATASWAIKVSAQGSQ